MPELKFQPTAGQKRIMESLERHTAKYGGRLGEAEVDLKDKLLDQGIAQRALDHAIEKWKNPRKNFLGSGAKSLKWQMIWVNLEFLEKP